MIIVGFAGNVKPFLKIFKNFLTNSFRGARLSGRVATRGADDGRLREVLPQP